jgi:fluoride ion exporter CrcB/FEX
MLGHDRRELAAIFIGGALGTVARAALETLAAAPITDTSASTAVDSSTRQPCAAA